MSATTILLYGPTGSGKTPQLGLLAEDVFVKTGKKTRVCTADFGGTDTIAPYIDLGIIELVEIGTSDPWIFMNKVVRGYTRDANGKWILDPKANEQIGAYGFESAHGLAQLLKLDMERKAASGVAIGGDTNTSFEVKGDGETLKIGTTKGFQKYAIPQGQVVEAMYESFKLPVQYVVWTAGISKDEDDILISTKVVGPDVIGKALTTVLPKDFSYCFRIGVTPSKDGKAEEHVMYLGTHTDPQLGSATALGNIRRPLDAPTLKDVTVKPANLVKALDIVRQEAKKAATDAIKKRIDLASKKA